MFLGRTDRYQVLEKRFVLVKIDFVEDDNRRPVFERFGQVGSGKWLVP